MSESATIEWVNHASFVLSYTNIRLLSDPWLWGSAFNNGWDLLSATRFTIEDFSTITHLWFSHEHPDHFSPPVLKQIVPEARQKITVIFQETKDRKVINYCQELGFQVQELKNHQWHELGPDFRVMCGKVPFFDSWLLIECGGQKILNANDCVVDGEGIASNIAHHTGKVDLLLTQFSYANWDGNPDQPEFRQASASEKLGRVKLQIDTFQPQYTIPCASFVYFSHEDNFFCNDSINTVRRAHDFILRETNTKPIVLYPGEQWKLGEPHDNAATLATYDLDYQLEQKTLRKSEPVTFEQLVELGKIYIQRVKSKNMGLLLRLMRMPPLRYFQPITFYLHDLNQVVSFDLVNGLRATHLGRSQADVHLAAESLAFVFKFDWGFDTLTVNGRFQASQANYKRLVKAFFVGSLNNTGRYLHPGSLFEPSFVRRALGKLSKLG